MCKTFQVCPWPISHRDQVGNALYTAGRAATWRLSAWLFEETSHRRRPWTSGRGGVSDVSRLFRRPPWRVCGTASSRSAPRPRPTSLGPSCSVVGERWGGPACPSSSPRRLSGTQNCRHWCCDDRSCRGNSQSKGFAHFTTLGMPDISVENWKIICGETTAYNSYVINCPARKRSRFGFK